MPLKPRYSPLQTAICRPSSFFTTGMLSKRRSRRIKSSACRIYGGWSQRVSSWWASGHSKLIIAILGFVVIRETFEDHSAQT